MGAMLELPLRSRIAAKLLVLTDQPTSLRGLAEEIVDDLAEYVASTMEE